MSQKTIALLQFNHPETILIFHLKLYFWSKKIKDFYQAGYQGFRNKNNIINEYLKINIGITYNELDSLTKENLIQLIQFINYAYLII